MKVDFIVIHCSATNPLHDIGASEIDDWHRKRGFSRIGYQYVVRRSGQIETGRKETEPGAHVQGYNSRSIGICVVGGINTANEPEANYTPSQEKSLTDLVNQLAIRYPNATVQGHRDFPGVNKACPCFDVREWWKHGGGAIKGDV